MFSVVPSLQEVVIHCWLHLNVNQHVIHVQKSQIVLRHIVMINPNTAQFGVINVAHHLYWLHVLLPAMRANPIKYPIISLNGLSKVLFWFIIELSLYIAIFYCSNYIKPNTVLNWNNRNKYSTINYS